MSCIKEEYLSFKKVNMKNFIKPLIAASIVLIGAVFVKVGTNADFWHIIIGSLGSIVVLIPAFLWYKDKLNL